MGLNQSVESAGMAFVKGANCKELIIWKNKQAIIYDEQAWTNKPEMNKLRDEMLWGWRRSGDKSYVYHCTRRMLLYV